MALVHVPVVGRFTYRDDAATPAAGAKIHFLARTPAVIDDDTVRLPKKLIVTLDQIGAVPAGFTLPTIGDDGVYYDVRERFPGARGDYTIVVKPTDALIDLPTAVPQVPPEEMGPIGPIGPRGYSAFEVAEQSGFVGTVEEWLESLRGIQGDAGPEGGQGPQGQQGIQGIQGPKGDQGDIGPQGPKGDTGDQGPKGDTGDAGAAGAHGTSVRRPAGALTISSGVVTVDLAYIEVWELPLSANVTGWVWSNLPAVGTVAEIRIDVIQHASEAKICVSPATAGTAGGAWTVATTLGARESLGVVVDHSGAVRIYPSGALA